MSQTRRDATVQALMGAAAEPAPTAWPTPLDLAEMLATDPEPPRWIIDDWMPCGYATMLAGQGGAGKSSIALHLSACIATGSPFFGLATSKRRVLYLSCEYRALEPSGTDFGGCANAANEVERIAADRPQAASAANAAGGTRGCAHAHNTSAGCSACGGEGCRWCDGDRRDA